MFKNYFKTAWRNIIKHPSYSTINVFGLTLGIASCLVIFLVVRYELSYDKFHSKADRIYRVTFNEIDFNPSVSMAVAPALRNDISELELVTQVSFRQSGLVKIGQSRYQEKHYAFVDQYFPSVFDYSWMHGDYKSSLSAPNQVVLTESMAKKYFGKEDAIGKLINLDNSFDLKVTGIIKDLPGNTHLPFNFLVSFETIKKRLEDQGALTNLYAINDGSFTYIVLPNKMPLKKIQGRMPAFVGKNWGERAGKSAHLLLQPLTDIHFDTRYLNNTISYTTSREIYYALAAVAALIILIACINFINLATAQAIRRAKEVGVRKVLGSNRSQLVSQFLSETTLMVGAALFLGALVTWLMLPFLSRELNIKITAEQLLHPGVMAMILLSAVTVIMLAGLYPAFIQSSFKPIQSLKTKAVLSGNSLTLRRGLVVFQFVISQMMIIGTLVVASQMNFFQNQDLGFDKEAVVTFGIPDKAKSKVLKQELLNMPGVKEVSLSSGPPVLSAFFTSFISPGAGLTKDDVTELKFIDEPYTDMFKLNTLAGEKIKRTAATQKDTVYDVVVNEAMINKLGVQDPQRALGKQVIINGNWTCTITGVVQNFQSESKHKKIRPCVLIYRSDNFFMTSVKLQPSSINKTIASIDKTWSALFPEDLFDYEFLDDHIAQWYRQEQKEYTAFKFFSGVAILIGCLGLYGLIAFAAAQRTKEVGIRKVLGASIFNIILLFSREFMLLIVVAFLIAAPVAYYLMNNWLQGFAYQVKMGIGIFLVAIASSVLIAICTIAYQAIKAAIANPVKSLRTE